MRDLDDRRAIEAADRSNMRHLLAGFPTQWEDAQQRAESLEGPVSADKIRSGVVSGLGGAAIGGDLLRGCLAFEAEGLLSRAPHGTGRGAARRLGAGSESRKPATGLWHFD